MKENDKMKNDFDEFDVRNHFDKYYNPLNETLQPGELNCSYVDCLEELEKRIPSEVIVEVDTEFEEDSVLINIVLDKKLDKNKNFEKLALDILMKHLCDNKPMKYPDKIPVHSGQLPNGREVTSIYFDEDYNR